MAFGYAAGFKAQGQCSERRLTEQLVALKQLVCSASLCSLFINPNTLVSGSLRQPFAVQLPHIREGNGDRSCARIAPRPTGMQRSRNVARRQERFQRDVGRKRKLVPKLGQQCTAHLRVLQHFFFQASIRGMCCLKVASPITNTLQGIGRRIGESIDQDIAHGSAVRYAASHNRRLVRVF